MEYSKVYIYGLMDGDNIIYVGKSVTPKHRLSQHRQTYNNNSLKIKILDFFFDKEIYWVDKLISEGHKLNNSQTLTGSEDWGIGDIIEIQTKTRQSVLDKSTNRIYKSLYSLSKEINLDPQQITSRIENPNKYPEFTKYKLI